jgi:hypothetical protein
VELIAPGPLSSNALVQTDPSIADQAAPGAPSTSGHKRKRPPTVRKRKETKTYADQVMTPIELPPYRGPMSPLDLVAIEIILDVSLKLFDVHLRLLVPDHQPMVIPSL